MRRRSKARYLLPDEISPHARHLSWWSAALWELSAAATRLALVAFAGILLFLLYDGSFHLKERLAPLVPDSVSKFFRP